MTVICLGGKKSQIVYYYQQNSKVIVMCGVYKANCTPEQPFLHGKCVNKLYFEV